MSQEYEFYKPESAFVRTQSELGSLQLLEHLFNVLQVFRPALAMKIHIINEHLAHLVQIFLQDLVDYPLKGCGGIFQPKGHHRPFIQFTFGY